MIADAAALRLRLADGARLVSDGAMGTALITHGVAPDTTLAANLTQPELVRAVHRSYADAGADFLTTNTFGVSADPRRAPFVTAGIALCEDEAEHSARQCWVWTSTTPRGLLESHADSHFPIRDRMLLFETAVDLKTTLAAIKLASQERPSMIGATFHFRADCRLPDGTTLETVASALADTGVEALGANCGESLESFVEIAARMRPMWPGTLLFQPAASVPGRYADCARFSLLAKALYAEGVEIVGGCCGTTAAHIAAVRESRPSERGKLLPQNMSLS